MFFRISFYYEISKEQDYICSRKEDSGMHLCSELPHYRNGKMECNCKYIKITNSKKKSSQPNHS